MLGRLAALLRAPALDDAEKTRVARLLNTALLASLAILIAGFVARAVNGMEGQWYAFPAFTGLLVLLLAALRRGGWSPPGSSSRAPS